MRLLHVKMLAMATALIGKTPQHEVSGNNIKSVRNSCAAFFTHFLVFLCVLSASVYSIIQIPQIHTSMINMGEKLQYKDV